MATLTLDGGRTLHYEDQGSGPLVVLLHGSPGTSRAWQRVGAGLADRFRVVAPDLPGHGQSDPRPPDGASDTAWVAGLIEALVDTLGTPRLLAGHSYGASVALAVAVRKRVAIEGLALLEPVALPVLLAVGEDRAFREARAVLDDYVTRHERGEVDAVRTMVDFWFGAGAFDRMPEPMRSHLRRETAPNVADVRATFREQWTRQDLAGIECPVLAVHGSRSPQVARRIVEAIAGLTPGGTVVALDGADHAMTATHGAALTVLLADHAGIGTRSSGRTGSGSTAQP